MYCFHFWPGRHNLNLHRQREYRISSHRKLRKYFIKPFSFANCLTSLFKTCNFGYFYFYLCHFDISFSIFYQNLGNPSWKFSQSAGYSTVLHLKFSHKLASPLELMRYRYQLKKSLKQQQLTFYLWSLHLPSPLYFQGTFPILPVFFSKKVPKLIY